MNYKKINKNKLIKYFKIEPNGIKYKNGRNLIKINIPFILNEDCARLAGLMPDGSLIKDLMRIYFTQEKDFSKILFFKKLIEKLFSPKNKIFIKNNKKEAYINSQTLARFFYHILEIPKSDEEMRIPKWVFNSPDSVKTVYLREAFAMEGTILKSLSEIRFITKDYNFALDIQKLLNQIGINSTVNKRIGGTHRTIQYRLSVYGKENFRKFKKIGFSYKLHIERFEELLKKYKIL